MTLGRMGVPDTIIDPSVLKQTPTYKWIKNRPFNRQALHNIRLTFQSIGVWDIFSTVYHDLIEYNSQDIKLQPLTFFNYIDVTITIHHTDTVSVAIACSSRPIAIDANDILQLFEALTRTETHLSNTIAGNCGSNDNCPSTVIIRCYRKWIVKMWHFGVDSIDEYTGKEFHVTFEDGISDLFRIYTKRMENNKQKVRVEHQEYSEQDVADAFVQELFPDGHLIDIDSNTAKEGRT
jgi:hypothetical protein